jgi:enoyl-CoA hydratase
MVSEPTEELVLFARQGTIAVITLNHPPVNVLNRQVLDRLLARFDEIEADPELRVVIMTSSAPKAFAAGADIREMAPMDSKAAHQHGARGQSVADRIERLPIPVIAAVHGACLGGGCEIALACDFVIASEDATFGQPEINLGVMPGWGGTQRLVRRVGASRARRWIFTGESAAATTAAAEGWVDAVVSRADLGPTARRLAESLAAKAPLALAAAKYSINRAIDRGLPGGLEFELKLWAQLFDTYDQKEGMRAFLEKRSYVPAAPRNWKLESRGFPWHVGSKGARGPRHRGSPKRGKRKTGRDS